LQTGNPIFRVTHESYAGAFSPSGEYVALTGARSKAMPKRIAVLKTADGSTVASFGTRFAASVAFHPDNRTLASGHWNNVTLWDARSGTRLALLISPQRPADPGGYDRDGRYIYGIAFSHDGAVLAAGSDDGELQVWEVATRRLLHSLKIGWGDVSNPAFSPDGKLVAAGTYADGKVSLVDVASGKLLAQIQVSMFGCGSVAFSPTVDI
jgi:WD40 repeat protein